MLFRVSVFLAAVVCGTASPRILCEVDTDSPSPVSPTVTPAPATPPTTDVVVTGTNGKSITLESVEPSWCQSLYTVKQMSDKFFETVDSVTWDAIAADTKIYFYKDTECASPLSFAFPADRKGVVTTSEVPDVALVSSMAVAPAADSAPITTDSRFISVYGGRQK